MLRATKGGSVHFSFLISFLIFVFVSCGGGNSGGGNNGGGGNGGGGGTTTTIPPAPSGLAAVAGDKQVALTWNASSGATGYHVKRGTASGGAYTQVGAPTGTVYGDTGLTDNTTYYYVVTAVNSAGESVNSNEVSATPIAPVAPVASVHVTVDVLANRHAISPYVYGVNFPSDTNYVTDSGATFVRWGGNASTRYNWLNFATNAAADWYFQNRPMCSSPGCNTALYSDSKQFVSSIAGAGAAPIMTIGMLPWVAKDGNATSYSFSVATYGAQCQTNPYLADDGDGIAFASGCPGTIPSSPTYITNKDPSTAHVPLADTTGSGPVGTVYRDAWVQALATKYGTQPHFYDMDNEIDIWGGTHRDVHPNPSGYDEMRDVFISEARSVKGWDSAAVRFGPVSCCWWFYWNGANTNDKPAHGGMDFLPWWFNEVAFQDKRDGLRSLDVFDFHAYPGGNTNGTALAQNQALALRMPRDFWDPTYVSEDGSINQPYATSTQPLKTIAFRIPRLRALVNSVFKDVYTTPLFQNAHTDPVPLSLTEWNVAAAGESDFSTALADADVFGILGRERMFAASRWTAADAATPAYQALKLYRNYDGAHHTFAAISLSATNDASDPGLFSSYAAIDPTGTTVTVMVINKSPSTAVSTAIALNHFTPATVTTYTLSQASPTTIVAAGPSAFAGTYSFAPYSATLLVISGTVAQAPAVEWDLNPDTIMIPAGGSVTLSPTIVFGTGTLTLNSQQSDSGITVALTQPNVTVTQAGTVTVNALATPGFYHYTVTGTDNAGTQQTQGGWIVVGNPAATLTKTGDGQSGATGSTLTLTATLNVGSSGARPAGASILFTTNAGALSSRIVQTDSSGNATVTLTLPNTAGTVTVTAEGPWPLGHPGATFTETAN